MNHFYPISYAASKWAAYGLDETELNRLIADGKLDTHVCETEGGELIVLADSDLRDLAAERIDKGQFAHLVGVKIGAGEAARKYNFSLSSLLKWAAQGHIMILNRDRQTVYLDEADVAYARKRADVKELKPGRSLF